MTLLRAPIRKQHVRSKASKSCSQICKTFCSSQTVGCKNWLGHRHKLRTATATVPTLVGLQT